MSAAVLRGGFRPYLLLLSSALTLSGCFSPTPRGSAPNTTNTPSSTSSTTPPSSPADNTGNKPRGDLLSIPNAVPRVEPLSKRGNPAFYEVMGQRYFVMPSAAGYVERGVASWYGPGFHEEFTSNGEAYDMYGMTAAHKTLPLPSFVQVTNLSNGKTVILRVNDRGPFKTGRIIDLSYTAAAKLDVIRAGTALVEVRAVTSGQDVMINNAIKTLYVQAGAFATASNADKLAAQLRSSGYAQAQVRSDMVEGRSLYRVRIGPIADVAGFDRVVAELKKRGIADARLALD